MQSTQTASQIERKLQQLRSQLAAQQSSPETSSPIILKALESAIAKLEVQLAAAPPPKPPSSQPEPTATSQAPILQKSPRPPRILPGNGQHRALSKLCGHLTLEGEDRVRLRLLDGTEIFCRVFGKNRKQKLQYLQTEQLYSCNIYPTVREGRLVKAQLHQWVACDEPEPEAWSLKGVFALKAGCPPAVLVQRDAHYLKRFGGKQKMQIFPQHIAGLEDCEIEPRRCYEFPIRREGDRIVLVGTPTPIEVEKPKKDLAVEAEACSDTESAA